MDDISKKMLGLLQTRAGQVVHLLDSAESVLQDMVDTLEDNPELQDAEILLGMLEWLDRPRVEVSSLSYKFQKIHDIIMEIAKKEAK